MNEDAVSSGERELMMTELKSCPFCGEKAAYRRDFTAVLCTSCLAEGPSTTPEGIADAWNTRAPQPIRDEEVETAARAIFALTHMEPFAAASRETQDEYREDARAALAAMQRPVQKEGEITDAMIEAGCEALHKMSEEMLARDSSKTPEDMADYDEGDVCRAIYRAMSAARIGGK